MFWAKEGGGTNRENLSYIVVVAMPKTLISVDPKLKPSEQSKPLHNRWHPDIPHVVEAVTGEVYRIETVDWTGGQIKNDDSAEDIKKVDLTQVHYLSGPIRVEDKEGKPAQPGDLLVVELCNLGPLPGDEWGFTGTFDRENGGSFLTDHFPCATKACWDFEGIYASSRHIPGVRFPGLIHPGLIGTAPSHELLAIWNEREQALVDGGPGGSGAGYVCMCKYVRIVCVCICIYVCVCVCDGVCVCEHLYVYVHVNVYVDITQLLHMHKDTLTKCIIHIHSLKIRVYASYIFTH